jgi:hypothetical protein
VCSKDRSSQTGYKDYVKITGGRPYPRCYSPDIQNTSHHRNKWSNISKKPRGRGFLKRAQPLAGVASWSYETESCKWAQRDSNP